MNIDRSKLKKGAYYHETYSLMASSSSVRLLLIIVAALNWYSMQINYAQAFT